MSVKQKAALTVSLTVPSTGGTTTAGTAFSLATDYSSMLVIGDLASHAGDTLDVYLQDSFDGGTTWYDALHFTQVSAASTLHECYSLTSSNTVLTIGKGTTGSPGVALAAAKCRPLPWGPTGRIVAVTGSSTSGASKVQTITLVQNVTG